MTAAKSLLQSTVAVSWEEHRRTRELCAWFGLPLHTFTHGGSGIGRYVRLSIATARLLTSRRPRVVYVQNPSLVLTLLVLALRRLLGNYRVMVDAHNEGVVPFAHPRWPIPMLTRVALRMADLTIVTNEALANVVKANGGRPFVLPDKLPEVPIQPSRPPLRDRCVVMVIATYAPDEPIAEIVEAARIVGLSYDFRFTGRESRMQERIKATLPPNVHQTGYLSEADYWRLMADCHLVLDLSLKPNCLVCGAYEALAMQKPMILSNNPATVELFSRVAVFAPSADASGITDALREARANYPTLLVRAVGEPASFEKRWKSAAARLSSRMESWLSDSDVAQG